MWEYSLEGWMLNPAVVKWSGVLSLGGVGGKLNKCELDWELIPLVAEEPRAGGPPWDETAADAPPKGLAHQAE